MNEVQILRKKRDVEETRTHALPICKCNLYIQVVASYACRTKAWDDINALYQMN